MRHFFDKSVVLDDTAMTALLNSARQELKKKSMSLAEMLTKTGLICFNASASEEYIPKGMDTLITTQNITLGQNIPDSFSGDLEKTINNVSGDIFGYLFGNIQEKKHCQLFGFAFQTRL